jgi:hypothetical protein
MGVSEIGNFSRRVASVGGLFQSPPRRHPLANLLHTPASVIPQTRLGFDVLHLLAQPFGLLPRA